MDFSKRTAHLQPEGAYQVMARAQELETQGRDIIHLEIGQPDFDTPDNISLTGIKAIANGRTRYNSTAGIAELRPHLQHAPDLRLAVLSGCQTAQTSGSDAFSGRGLNSVKHIQN